ncbi:MAG: acyl-CoA thioesterase II [Xanthomonadales bacterium]|nr:acyl-CoA thioesterase II [Xanthomonadales bacterium]
MKPSRPLEDPLDDLIHLLKLERLEDNLFRGESRDIGSRQVFGGQVLGQALSAANQTVDDRCVHSLHAYFLRRGDMQAPIVYEVDRQRDGGSFSNRRVVAIQHGRPIFNMAASFQKAETGLEHQSTMPEVPDPESLTTGHFEGPEGSGMPEKIRRLLVDHRPFEFRWVQPTDYQHPVAQEPRRQLWFRADGQLPDDEHLHRAMLAYASDFGLLPTALLPHGKSVFSDNLIMASLDHAMWFHRPFRIDEWLLYSYDSPNAVDARGLSRGQIFRRDGTLVCSLAQEGLMRFID